MKKKTTALVLAAVLALSLVACSGGETEARGTVTFANAGWDSIQFHSAVAGYIAETAFGYKSWEVITGSTPVMHQGLMANEVDVHMEMWTDNLPTYHEDLAAGKFQEMGVNFSDARGGYYVPRYVIEGDAARGIEPMAPDLKTVADLAKYKDLFPDEEKPGRSRVYGAIAGWTADIVMYNKYLHYGLDKDFEYFRPGSEAAMIAAFTAAYTKGQPFVGYYWEPNWVIGMYDFVLLEEPTYTNQDDYMNGKCENPFQRVMVATSNQFAEKDPEFCEFLKNYHTSSALTGEALAYMQQSGASHLDTAKWFLQEHDDLIDSFLNPEQAQKVRDALNAA